ncbi:hypothetical protein BCV70DRAFT_205722 [Testicularia cyperi]|uniref:CCZ1/INTU/HSP4 first Longin domain-containing protein n=1 Tax=Testicularia cyperi TaxID=1882483 RepID=A0A317XUY4_9BASI|nr:hypothetical protein BCV70DRAFT_205722 [Testicularia cyperi]
MHLTVTDGCEADSEVRLHSNTFQASVQYSDLRAPIGASMSFLPFNPLSPLGYSSSATQISFKPATLSYFTIFCPALKPPKSKTKTADESDKTGNSRRNSKGSHGKSQHSDDDDEEGEDSDAAREAAQILFYTSRARAALKEKMLRQIGVAKGMVEFCSMVSGSGTSSASDTVNHAAATLAADRGRSWNVHSSKRRMVLVEVEHGIWVHASIDLPHTVRRTPHPSNSEPDRTSREYHDSLLADEWLEESIKRAWRDWLLLNGSPAQILSQKKGRVALERSLEKYFSVWAWSWDLEFASSSQAYGTDTTHSNSRSVLCECIAGFPVVPRAPRFKLAKLMHSPSVQSLQSGKNGRRELIILADAALLWPPTDAGCLDSEDEDLDEIDPVDSTFGTPKNHRQPLDAEIKSELLRRIVSHLNGLEKEKDLIRAAAVSSVSDGRRRGTSGAIRERSSAGSNKRDIRTGLLSSGAPAQKRVVSSPVSQIRSTSASSTASSLNDTSRWSNWGSVFSGFGRLPFKGGETAGGSETPVPTVSLPDQSNPGEYVSEHAPPVDHTDDARTTIATKSSSATSNQLPERSGAETPDGKIAASYPKSAPSLARPGPLDLIQQRLAEALPIQEAGGKIWSGAETAFRGLGASLGLGNGSTPNKGGDEAANSNPSASETKDAPGPSESELSDHERVADASIDADETDSSIVTKVSILEPEVNVSELAAALEGGSAPYTDSQAETAEELSTHDHLHTIQKTIPSEDDANTPTDVGERILSPGNHLPSRITEEGSSSGDSASIRTGSSAKAFPSISVTSAAWYNTKALKSDASTGIASSSPKLPGLVDKTGKPTTSSSFANISGKDTGAWGNNGVDDSDVGDTSLGAASFQSEHHDFELDGWGQEQPAPFQSFRCFVGKTETPIPCEAGAQPLESSDRLATYQAAFTTRRLLTLVLIEPEKQNATETKEEVPTEVLDGAWQLLRRVQRLLNDHERVSKVRAETSTESSVQFLHLDGPTCTFQSSIDGGGGEKDQDREVRAVAEAHCLSAMGMMQRHDIVEAFARSSNGKTWTASRRSQPRTRSDSAYGHTTLARCNQTFLVQSGKKISIVDCDHELRKLANEYPSFGI